MFATVEKIIKAKKPRKIKTKKPRIATKKETQGVSIIVPEAAQAPEDDIPYTTMALI